MLAEARERLEAVPASAGTEVQVLRALDLAAPAGAPAGAPGDVVVLPPGVPATGEPALASGRAEAWDALLGRLGATPRVRAGR
jgi:hypothetical protein